MKDERKTKKLLIAELAELRQRVSELENSEPMHKRAEEALRESEEKYRTLVEQSLEGIVIVVGPPPKMVFANSSFVRMMGYTLSELLAMSPQELEDLVHPVGEERRGDHAGE